MASLSRTLFRPARHALTRSTARAPRSLVVRGMATVGNAPPMEPQKERPREMAVGEFEGATFTIEPLRRVGEDEKTMRARLVCTSIYLSHLHIPISRDRDTHISIRQPWPFVSIPSLPYGQTIYACATYDNTKTEQTSPVSAASSRPTSSSRPSQTGTCRP